MLNMSEPDQRNNHDASAFVPLKRKRGRPRKYPRLELDHGGSVHDPRNQNADHGESSRVPPGFTRVNRSQPHQVGLVNDANDYMVGQVVHGVIEALFDAGYLLTVRVGNSETTLRGVVFKPGHYVPVNADIDIAPGVQMIRRNEIPLPRENYAQVHSRNSRSGERNGTVHAVRGANPVANKSKQVASVVTERSGITRGNVVPVVLQPVNLSNGAAAKTSSTAHAVSSKGKQVLDAAHPSNGSTTSHHVQAVETQLLHSQSQNNHHVVASGIQHESRVNQNSAETLQEAEAASMKSPGMPFEKLLTEVIKRTQVPSQSTDANTSSAVKLSAEDSSVVSEDDVDDTDQALSVEPLRAIQPDLHNQPAVVSTPLENYRTAKMTELLQVLQENMTENPAALEQDSIEDPRPKLDEQRSPEAKHRD